MASVDNYLLLIIVTILSLITHSFGTNLEGISRTTAKSLILLKHYQEQVAIYGRSADETYRLQFIDKWIHLIQDHNTAVEILNFTEKDWMYTLHIASQGTDIKLMVTSRPKHWVKKLEAYLADSVVILHSKLLAMYHAMLYLEGIFYYSLVSSEVRLHDCKNVAIQLLIFINQGTDELVQSVIRVLDSLSSAGLLNFFKQISEDLEKTNDFQLKTSDLIIQVELLNSSDLDDIELIETTTRLWYENAGLITNFLHRRQENFLRMFTRGALEDSVSVESYEKPIHDFDEMKPFWSKAVNINKYCTKQLFNGPNEDVEYTMAYVLRASLINRAEINNVCRRNIVEKFEKMIRDKILIFTNKA